jgi:fatty acid desaturase
VPNRWDLSGDATEWLDKRVLIAFPVLMAVADVSLLFARTVQFRSLGKSVRIPAPVLLFLLMKLPLLAGFGYVMLCSALVRPLGAWFFPVFFVLVFTPMLVFGVTSWAKGRA